MLVSDRIIIVDPKVYESSKKTETEAEYVKIERKMCLSNFGGKIQFKLFCGMNFETFDDGSGFLNSYFCNLDFL